MKGPMRTELLGDTKPHLSPHHCRKRLSQKAQGYERLQQNKSRPPAVCR
jgi:hypothetical protein